MKETFEDNDLAELVVIIGVFILLLACITIEAVNPESNLETILNGLVIVLTGIGGHLFGKKAAVATQQPQQQPVTQQPEQPKQEETS